MISDGEPEDVGKLQFHFWILNHPVTNLLPYMAQKLSLLSSTHTADNKRPTAFFETIPINIYGFE